MRTAPSDPDVASLIFLPGASGNTHFWRPLADRLGHPGEREFWSYPGFGGVPSDPAVGSFDALVARLVARITRPVDLLAQSMGGVLAVRAALERPGLVKHLVLSVTSGGVDVAALGALDWRWGYRELHPEAPDWFETERRDVGARLRELTMPVLLLWGDADPISPIAVGEHLAAAFPNAELCVFEGGTHDLVLERASDVAPWVERHLKS